MTHMNTPEAVNRSLIQVIDTARKDAGLSQRDLANRSGVPLTSLHAKLKGHRSFTIIEVGLIADTLGMTLTDLALQAERQLTQAA